MGFFDFATKGIDKVESEELNYDPADAKPLLDQLYNKKNRGLGFYKTVEKRYDNFEDKGPGTLYVSDNDGKPNYRFFPDMGEEFIDKQNLKITRAEGIANAPLHLAPLLALGTGIPKISKDRTRAQIKKARMGADESNLEGAVNLNKTVDGVFQMPSNQARDIVKIAKKNKISYKQAEEYYNLKLRGIEPTGTINPGSSVQDLTQRFMKSPKDRFPDGGDVQNIDIGGMGDLGIDQFGYGVRKKQSVGEYRNKLFNDAGFRKNSEGDFVFDLASLKQFLKGEKRRLVSQYFQTREGQSVKGSFEKTRDATKLDFLETYDGYMKLTGSKPNLHHEFAAMVSAPLYDGLALSERPGSEWMQLTELLNLNDIYPGSPVTDPASLGGPQSNLTQMLTKGRAGAPPEPHDILHKQFYKEMGIQDTPKGQNSWWDKRMYKIKSGTKGRLEVAQEYADIVNEGNRIIKTAMSQINALFGKNQDPQKIANLMIELADTGKLRITDSKFRLKSVEAIVKIIENEVKADMGFTDELELTKAVKKYNIDNYGDYVKAVDLLANIADYNESMRVYGVRPRSITHLKHKQNVEAYMKLTQTELELGDVETYKAREAKIEDFTYKRVTPLPINKQLEFMFPEPKPEQLELLKKENPLL